MSQKPDVKKIVGVPITVIHQADPYVWSAAEPEKHRTHPLDSSSRFVARKPTPPMVEWRKGIMLPADPPLPTNWDGYAVREQFMQIRNESDCLEFLNRYGMFSQLPDVDFDFGWTFNAIVKWQEVFADLARLKPDRWEEYANSLMAPGHKTNILAVLGALRSTVNSITFQPNNFKLPSIGSAKYIGVIRTGDVISTIFTTLQIDHVRGAKFGVCARADCPRFYEITSRHKRKYCSPVCAHLETVRRVRKRQKATLRRRRPKRGLA